MSQLPAEFALQGRNQQSLKSLTFPDATDCIVANPDKAFTLSITPVATFDAELFATTGKGTVTRVTIVGFPAFTQVVSEDNPSCFLGVDVADGQMLYLQWRYSKSTGKPPSAELCANATRVATAAMKVLGAS